MRATFNSFGLLLASMAAILLAGCASGTTNVNPNPDPAVQKPRTTFAAYAATREYPADLPKTEDAAIRAEVDYQLDVINFVNLGDTELKDVEVWVNEHYVVLLGTLPVKQQRGANFHVLFDKAGQQAPSRGTWVEMIELNYDGQMHSVRVRPAD